MMAFDSRIYFTIDLIISSFNQHHKPGQTFSKFLYFGYADRCNAVVAGQENKAELFQRFFSQDFSNPKIKILTQQFVNAEDQEARRTSKPNFRNFDANTASKLAKV